MAKLHEQFEQHSIHELCEALDISCGNFKKEEAYRRDHSSVAAFRKSVDEYIRFYNEVRPHQTLLYKTPAQFEELHGNKNPDVKITAPRCFFFLCFCVFSIWTGKLSLFQSPQYQGFEKEAEPFSDEKVRKMVPLQKEMTAGSLTRTAIISLCLR